MFDFTKYKFLELPFERRHKKCAQILKLIYDHLLDKKNSESLICQYQQLQQWQNEPILETVTFSSLSNRYHQHLFKAKCHLKEHSFLPSIRKGDKILGEKIWDIAIYLDHLRSAHNVGSIIRTIEAFALGNLYFSPNTPFIDCKQVQDTSMETYQWVSCNNTTLLEELPKPVIVMDTSSQAISLNDFIFPETFTLVLGNEEYGCSDSTLAMADYLLEIPLRGRKNSLNVANAFAIAAGEIQRQRQQSKKKKEENYD